MLDYEPPTVEEELPMPMIGKTRVDKKMKELFDLLEQGGVTVEDANNRIRVTHGTQSCYLPTRHVGNSMTAEIKRLLNSIGVVMPAGDELPGKGAHAHNLEVPQTNAKSTAPWTAVTGVDLSEATMDMLLATIGSYRDDLEKTIQSRINAAVDSAVELLGADAEYKARAEQAEHELEKVRAERERAVADLVSQRDEARKEAHAVKEELAGVRRSLAGLKAVL